MTKRVLFLHPRKQGLLFWVFHIHTFLCGLGLDVEELLQAHRLARINNINRISMIKRSHSKGVSQHLDANIKEELRDIENLQLTSQNILEKLLNPAASEKKMAQESRKYDPKFTKKDYETLAEENHALKQQLRACREETTGLKFRLGEYERKVRFLEGIQEKWENSVKESQENKKQPVYTEILKKKIQQLSELYLGAQEKIKQLKQLPHISVFQQSNIEKEYLLRETIRLKAVISSSLASEQEGGIENKFLKLIKQDNQKLKSTIRLHQNDKNLLKSRQILQKRQINDYKREIEQLKAALAAKDTQIQTQANQYKNMIFKKAQQFSSEQKKKENQEFDTLRKNYDNLLDAHRQLQAQRDSIANQYEKLRKNEKLNETKKNSEDKEKNDLRTENGRLRKMLQDLRDELDREREAARQIEHESRKKRRQKKLPTYAPRVEQYPPVKYEDIELALMTLEHQLKNGAIYTLSDLFDEEELRCGKLVDIFAEEPLTLDRAEATKLARYIVEGNSSRKVIYNEMATASKGLCLATLKAALSKLDECRNSASEDSWRCILARSKKLLPQLERMTGEIISKEAFLTILGRHINEPFGDYVTLSLLQSFDFQASDTEIMVSVDKIVELLTRILEHKTTR